MWSFEVIVNAFGEKSELKSGFIFLGSRDFGPYRWRSKDGSERLRRRIFFRGVALSPSGFSPPAKNLAIEPKL